MELNDLIGNHVLTGIEYGQKIVRQHFCEENCNYVKFTIDGITYMALEDPDDGYRSYMNELEIVEEPCKIKLPNILVCCHMKGDGEWAKNDILIFVDIENGKTILEIGTENYDDFYPYCVLNYYPENMSCNEDVIE